MTTQSPPQESYEVDMTLWQREFGKLANQNNLDGPGYLRLSQSGQCIRRLYYTHLGEIPSKPDPLVPPQPADNGPRPGSAGDHRLQEPRLGNKAYLPR